MSQTLDDEWEVLSADPETKNITMGDKVLFVNDEIILAGKIVGICPFYNGSLQPPSYYYEIETDSGDFYEIPDDGEILKRR